MRIEEVRAVAFGPLRGETLRFTPGMTLVWGPNESGKSSWHAALYAAICGLRRSRGAPRKEERRFAERHRPWVGSDWRVSTVVELADGRRIELSHDLAGLVDCRATDLDLGRDVSRELMHEGTPDGARLLGLTRETLLPTVCVRQADLLGILDDPGRLQDAVQRAAATAGVDETAEEALARLDRFRREHVGTERANSTRPLRQALDRVEQAEATLSRARAAHLEFLDLAAQHDAAEQAAAAAHADLQRARAEMARQELAEIEQRYADAVALATRFPDRSPPEPSGDGMLAARVTEALSLWEHRPDAPTVPEGPTAAELARRLEQLPPPPEGDIEIAPEVIEAWERWRSAAQAVALAEEERSQRGRTSAGRYVSGDAPSGPSARPLGAVAALGVLAATGLLIAGRLPSGLLVLAVSALAGFLAVRVRARARNRTETTSTRRRRELAEAADALHTALSRRGADVSGTDLEAAARGYATACRDRARQAAEAARAGDLESRLAARRELDRQSEFARRQRLAAEHAIREVAAALAIEGAEAVDSDPGLLAERLRDWRSEHADAQRRVLDDLEAWHQLQLLTGGADLDKLAAEVDECRARAAAFDGLEPLEPDPGYPDLFTRIDDLEGRARDESLRLASLAGRLEDRSSSEPSVAEAEEWLARARAELERLRRLEATVSTASSFLEQARERMHRDIAPRLAASVNRSLPAITDGRYEKVAVDPATLEVRVRGGGAAWREARLLSHGTAEQIYLLLRVALAEHLVTPGEPAPLLLDDVTVQSDESRTSAILDLLLALSRDRQIIAFSQEVEVLEWAEERLTPPDHSIVELRPQPVD